MRQEMNLSIARFRYQCESRSLAMEVVRLTVVKGQAKQIELALKGIAIWKLQASEDHTIESSPGQYRLRFT